MIYGLQVHLQALMGDGALQDEGMAVAHLQGDVVVVKRRATCAVSSPGPSVLSA